IIPIGPAPPPEPTGANPAADAPAAAPAATDTGDTDGSISAPTSLDMSGVRTAVPPAPGSDAARTSPAPALGPEPPTSGWFDSGLAPISPICALLSPPN